MGTSLTGLTPATTYDALIKVGDNGPLSATAKVLSDGLGNDSKLNLSTASVGIGTSSPSTIFGVEDTNANVAVVNVIGTSPNYIFDVRDDGTSVFRVAGNGNVGIGTSSPSRNLVVYDTDVNVPTIGLRTDGSGLLTTNGFDLQFANNNTFLANRQNGYMSFLTGNVERIRILADGGLTFNGDTAQANALDDYEEGTWTMGISFGGGSTGVTYGSNTGTYTKIGRQVTVNGYLLLSNKGSSTGSAVITGLPFTIPNNNANYSAPALWFSVITSVGQVFANGTINTTTISLQQTTLLGVNSPLSDTDFSNNSGIIVNFTYFV